MGNVRKKYDNLEELLSIYKGSVTPVYDGKIHRFAPPDNHKKSGWFIGHSIGNNFILMIGDFREGDDYNYWSNKKRLDKAEKEEFERLKTQTFEKIKSDREAYAIDHKSENQKQIASALKVSDQFASQYPYFINKKIDKKYCSEFIESKDGIICIIPMKDKFGEIWNYQRIYSNGTKIFAKGKCQGLFAEIFVDKNECFVCEGFATAVSIHKATGKSVVIAFTASNLVAVSEIAKERFESVMVCADNDQFNETNTGLKYAEKVKFTLKIPYIYPEFKDISTKPTDYNDLECLYGIDEVKKQILKEISDADYDACVELFNDIFKNPRMCIFDKILIAEYKGKDVVVENKITSLKGYAISYGIQTAKIEPCLYRWIDSFNERLLLDFGQNDDFDYIGETLSFVKVKNIKHEYFVELMKQWFAGIWSRYYNPNSQNVCPIWKGDQGLGKDTLLNHMLSGFGKYYDPNFDVSDRPNEMYQIMYRKMILNISEFDRTARHDVATLKKIITSSGAFFRPPYARKAEHFDFRCSFISSSNKLDVLVDNTGNRRYWLFDIDSIDWSYEKDISEKIMNQAFLLYKSGFKASDDALNLMKKYISNLTPDSDEEIEADVIDAWVERSKLLCLKLKTPKLKTTQADPIFKDLSVIFDISTYRVKNILNRANFKTRNSKERFYTYDAMLNE